jgi:ABC-type molybdate transport system substrate-binding protein
MSCPDSGKAVELVKGHAPDDIILAADIVRRQRLDAERLAQLGKEVAEIQARMVLVAPKDTDYYVNHAVS